jgi:hypothetical protein
MNAARGYDALGLTPYQARIVQALMPRYAVWLIQRPNGGGLAISVRDKRDWIGSPQQIPWTGAYDLARAAPQRKPVGAGRPPRLLAARAG